MFASVKSWMDLTAVVRPYLGRTGTGAKQFGKKFDIKCYAEGKIEVVSNHEGKEVVSNKRLYVDGNTDLDELDNIIFEGRETEIKTINYYYRNGKVDLKVVYL